MNEQFNEVSAKVRLLQKTLEDWELHYANYVPLYGEICMCEIENKNNPDAPPIALLKVGNNRHSFKQLNWIRAEAADVYTWAKQDAGTFINWLFTKIVAGDGLVIADVVSDDGTIAKKIDISEDITFIIDANL